MKRPIFFHFPNNHDGRFSVTASKLDSPELSLDFNILNLLLGN